MLEMTDGGEGYQVCKAGETLDSRQTTLLKMFGVVTAEFRVDMTAYWSRAKGAVTILERKEGEMDTDGK
jgi:mRNA turnover protein 4